ncbi:MAG TPA: hypothetical protein VFX59_07190 [Polyangiales bacterium]|nr:hypothetical protein [Polyangiales bacterium]
MPLALLLLLLFASPAFAQDLPAYVPPAPAQVAYESQLRTRLGWLDQQEYALRHDDEWLRCRRWKVMGIVSAGVGALGSFFVLTYWGLRSGSPEPLSTREKATIGSLVGVMGAGALTGLGFAIAAPFTNPHRESYRALRVEHQGIRRELRRLADERAAKLSLSADGFTLRF